MSVRYLAPFLAPIADRDRVRAIEDVFLAAQLADAKLTECVVDERRAGGRRIRLGLILELPPGATGLDLLDLEEARGLRLRREPIEPLPPSGAEGHLQ